MLAEQFEEHLWQHLPSVETIQIYPSIDDRQAWEALPEQVRNVWLSQGEEYLGYTWPVLPATLFMEFLRNGNRTRYENISFDRRKALTALVMAECLESQGRFLDDIVNGIWSMCEETSWVIPAHNTMQPVGLTERHPHLATASLPDKERPVIDLFAAETGALLAWTIHLLQSRLDAVSPLLISRINQEVRERLIKPFLEHDSYSWMGFCDSPIKLNNWNPWINSNLLAIFLLMEPDEELRHGAIVKILRSLDRFIDAYPEDGGCDEGPANWGRAGGSLFDALELLALASGRQISLYDDTKIQAMGSYIQKMHIDGAYFVNFADSPAVVSLLPCRVYRYGTRIDDIAMQAMASNYFHQSNDKELTFSRTPMHVLLNLFMYSELMQADTKPIKQLHCWMPDTEIMCAREREEGSGGIFLAAKGGHNGESHNHNDVGSFMVYADGEPVLIDIGVEEYSAATFGPDRYTIWTMQSGYHNLPSVNGHSQQPGQSSRATATTCLEQGRVSILSLELAQAYAQEAGIRSWRRTCSLIRESSGRSRVVIVEEAEFQAGSNRIELHFMTLLRPEQREGEVILGSFALQFGEKPYKIIIETLPINDRKLAKAWGQQLYRITARFETVHSHTFKLSVTLSKIEKCRAQFTP
ncbi:heparinase II/III domain-containing protein [Paenibacillus daejeonensis]|uniref:heparinase II/III domain-containing protein n=1 Tax=Paenibacillus daejeonensis TaxID=135193 RepID=UPI000377D485|nr:heparinase II/III family protein [Paenibacillus daejeonensis]